MEKPARLSGIDLIRGIGAYAVAILHSGDETNSLAVGYWASELRQFCGFVVPFFLVTSFYLLINKFLNTGKSYPVSLRVKRLLIPYAFWTVIYLIIRSLKFFVLNESENFERIGDLTSVVFFGAASVPLYFIPLLFTGTFLLVFAEQLIKKQVSIYQTFVCFFMSIGIYQYSLNSDNYYKLGPNIAFDGMVSTFIPDANNNQLIRVLLVLISWAIYCAPYVFAAVILNYVPIKTNSARHNRQIAVISLVIFFVVSFLGLDKLPQSIYEVSRATLLLLFAICISQELPASNILKSVGLCSFGIYLMHYMVIQVFRIIVGKIDPNLINYVSVPSQLILASLGFGISWLVTSLFIKRKYISRIMFGT